jgi:ZIP family zinc transporter
MPTNEIVLLTVAAVAGIASPLGGAVGLLTRTGTLLLSIAVGLAAGVLLGTFAFEMLPQALSSANMAAAILGFIAGFLLVYSFDLYLNRGYIAGDEADQRDRIMRLRRKGRRTDSEVTLLAGGTSVEELIEGISIGVGMAADPGLGLMIGLAIGIDNFVEGLSIAELIRAEDGPRAGRRVMAWTSLIGVALFTSALVGWFLLRDLSAVVLGTLLAAGAGGMFYLTITDLVPKSEKTHFQQSAALAIGSGFLLVFVLSHLELRI